MLAVLWLFLLAGCPSLWMIWLILLLARDPPPPQIVVIERQPAPMIDIPDNSLDIGL